MHRSQRLQLPCMLHTGYAPPYTPSNCSTNERAAIISMGSEMIEQMQPLLGAKPDTGMWLVSCIQHTTAPLTLIGNMSVRG
jgi:hypothetical protein